MDISLYKKTFGLLNDSVKYANNQKNDEKNNFEKLDLSEIVQVNFPVDQYYREQTSKKQIVLHHTVSGQGVDGDINWWLQTTSRIATPIIIDYKGKIFQCFSTKYWAHHLGIKQIVFDSNNIKNVNNTILNKQTIGVEIDSWGGLVRFGKYWYPAEYDSSKKKYVANRNFKPITNVQVYDKPFRGFYGFEKYTDEQIESVRKLLVYWHEVYNIPLKYNEDMWDVSKKALSGESGVWSHVSYRNDKSDCHPQNELIEMLKSLE